MKEWLKKVQTGASRVAGAVVNFLKNNEFIIAAAAITVIAMILRVQTFDFRSNDYNVFLSKWVEYIRQNGFRESMKNAVGDYTPAYYYVLYIISLFRGEPLYGIKIVSCVFDIVLAAFIALIVFSLTRKKLLSVIGYAAVLFLPTVFLNSGMWAQCDSIFTAFCAASVFFLIKKKNILAVVLYGVAFAFKLQAVFLAPLFAVLFFKHKIPLFSPLIVLLVYFIPCLPPLICGRNLYDLMTIYLSQAQEYGSVTMNAPTILALLGNVGESVAENISITFVIMCLGCVALVIYLISRYVKADEKSLVDFSMLFALAVPFLLPHMHERYFFVADVFAVAYFLIHPKRVYTLILTEFCSAWVVCNYLFGMSYFNLGIVAIIELINVVLLCKDLLKDYAPSLSSEKAPRIVGSGDESGVGGGESGENVEGGNEVADVSPVAAEKAHDVEEEQAEND